MTLLDLLPGAAAAVPGPSRTPTSDELAIWFHYEEVAMHFNQMLIQFRLQMLGGAGSLATLALYLIGEKVSEKHRPRLRALASTGLLVLVIAAASFDLGYYNQLLRGAVNALIRFEKEHPGIYLSTEIERTAQAWPWFIYGAYLFVGLVLVVHCGLSWWSYWESSRKPKPRRKAEKHHDNIEAEASVAHRSSSPTDMPR